MVFKYTLVIKPIINDKTSGDQSSIFKNGNVITFSGYNDVAIYRVGLEELCDKVQEVLICLTSPLSCPLNS